MTIQRTILIINLAIIALGAYFGVGLFYKITASQLRADKVSVNAPDAVIAAKNRGHRPFGDYRAILTRDLFKTTKTPLATAPKKEVNLDDMEQTKLNLKLWGTVTGTEEQAYAVIEDTQKREQNLYRVGDSIQNAMVKMIRRAKVVLQVDGRDEVLAMEEIKQGGSSRRVSHSRPTRSTPSSGVRSQRVSMRRSMINDAINDVTKLMTQVKIQPHMENGQPDGLAISNIKPNSIFRRMGLRNGDILKKVEGADIRTVDDALRLYDSMKSADSVSVEIERRGSLRQIDYTIR
ncbi:MAG: type II secretion system protein GspC [Desulfobacteraceae bacterium]|jgi:general secretion pathway protein C